LNFDSTVSDFAAGAVFLCLVFFNHCALDRSGNGQYTRLKQSHYVKQTLPKTDKELSQSGRKREKTSRISQPHQSWAKVVT
jgi:hypothetical protein